MNYWLMKTEPSTFGIDHLARKPKKTAMWDGVRNYQARNMLRDDFHEGDLAFIYHSSTDLTGIAGIAQVVRTAYPDPTQFDRKSDHYDAGAKREDPSLGPLGPCDAIAGVGSDGLVAEVAFIRNGRSVGSTL